MWMRRAAKNGWLGPNGEREVFEGNHGAVGYKILKKIFMGEEMQKKPQPATGPDGDTVQEKGLSGEEAEKAAMQRIIDEIGEVGDGGPKTRAALLERGWVSVSGGNVPVAIAKARESLVKAEEGIRQFMDPAGAIDLAWEGVEGFVRLTPEDLEETGTFDEAITHAQTRAKAGTATSSFDFGPWMSRRLRQVSWLAGL